MRRSTKSVKKKGKPKYKYYTDNFDEKSTGSKSSGTPKPKTKDVPSRVKPEPKHDDPKRQTQKFLQKGKGVGGGKGNIGSSSKSEVPKIDHEKP